MKKLLLAFVCLFALASLVACGEETNTEKEYKLGMGIVVSTASTKNATADANGTAQIDATVATVVLEGDKIVSCRIDVAQNKVTVSSTGEVTVPAKFETKRELGDRYGMAGKVDNDGNGVKLEWYAQTDAFEKYVVGMTGAQVAAIETQFVNNHHIAKDQALLDAGCSMQITDFMAAVAKACEDAQGVTFKTSKEFTLGVAANTSDSGSKAATAEAAGAVQVYSDFAAAVIVEGKIVASLNDAIQPKFAVSATGELTPSFKASKRELKEEYGMAGKVDNNGDGIKLEWYVQSLAFSNFVVGMTGAEVAAMETQFVNNHNISTNEDLLKAGCTIEITGIKAVVAEAAANAR